MRVVVVLGLLLAFGTSARELAAQSGEVRCPPPGTQLTFSLGGRLEAVSDQGNYVCRLRIPHSQKTFDLMFGAFTATAPTVQANAAKLRSLVPFQVGRKVTFENAGASVRGTDGFWFHEVSIERFETVTTPAGTYSAFVILWNEQTMGAFGKWQSRYWYAPDVNYTVKFEYTAVRGNPPPNYPKNWELTSYDPPWRPGGGAGPEAASARPGPVAQAPPPPSPAPAPAPPPIKPTPTVAAAAPPPPAAASAASGTLDGNWRMDMHVTTSQNTNGECQARPSVPFTFTKGKADGPSAKLEMMADGQLTGWMHVPFVGTGAVPFLVKVTGQLADGVFSGQVFGRCTGNFTMTRQ